VEEQNHFEARRIDFHNRLRDGYHEFISHFSKQTEVIDASQPIDKVWSDFQAVIKKYFEA
jgi:dTMP kinase